MCARACMCVCLTDINVVVGSVKCNSRHTLQIQTQITNAYEYICYFRMAATESVLRLLACKMCLEH